MEITQKSKENMVTDVKVSRVKIASTQFQILSVKDKRLLRQ